ncbi:MAG TPA: gamma-glutamyltransferase family protein [Dehalococcoidia bacterium]|nr:gamma-glutamyltransferase family protein [Dehalococcoidia bacterium]
MSQSTNGSHNSSLPGAAFKLTATRRPVVRGRRYVASTGHHLASLAATRMLERGGNAIDAGVAAGVCLNVLLPDMTCFGGVAPIMIYLAAERRVVSIDGLGHWPRAASLEYFQRRHGGTLPAGIERAVTPAAADAWLTALERFGTLPLSDVLAPALDLAANGFPLDAIIAGNFASAAEKYARYPSSAAVFLPGGRPPRTGELFVQRDLARTFERLIAAASGKEREAGIRAARDLFYRGEIAREMAEFSRSAGGLMDEIDIAGQAVEVEEPPHVTWHGYEVYASGFWCQGPALLQALNLLAEDDLASHDPGSPEYVHLVAEALKLAFADREAFYGDPKFVDVPMVGLLSREYAVERRALINADRAIHGMAPHGDPWRFEGRVPAQQPVAAAGAAGPIPPDTTYLCVMDEWGNGFSATPSDPVEGGPIVPGLGFPMSPRGSQSWLDPDHASSLQPGKRPRLTPNPALALRDGDLFATFGTPGGDIQVQTMLQVFLNVTVHGLDPQAALEAPRFGTFSHPGSFYPHAFNPDLLRLEGRFSAETIAALEGKGHLVDVWPDYSPQAGSPCLIVREYDGLLAGGADPRRVAYAIGW